MFCEPDSGVFFTIALAGVVGSVMGVFLLAAFIHFFRRP